MKVFFTLLFVWLLGSTALWGQPADVVWNSQSRNSSGSMPCGGGDIGMNVWVEDDDVFFYLCRSGSFDENNTLLKQGRFRIRLTPNPFAGRSDFRQTLHLKDGYVSVTTPVGQMHIWADVFHPVVHVEVETKEVTSMRVSYESWRTADRVMSREEGLQCSYAGEWPGTVVTTHDSILVGEENLTFFHRNASHTIVDAVIKQQGLESEASHLYNPLRNLIFGGRIAGDLIFSGTRWGHYCGTEYEAWTYKSRKPANRQSFRITLHAVQTPVVSDWEAGLEKTEKELHAAKDKEASRRWWNEFWQRSFVRAEGEAARAARNYDLYRYMAACNAFGQWPAKPDGGLFTFDPSTTGGESQLTPDYRRGGAGTLTAHEMALVYWPMLKNGDTDLMKTLFECYRRLLPTAQLRSQVYWGYSGACFSEETENFGLVNPTAYGLNRPEGFDKGREYHPSSEYEWDGVLETCRMVLDAVSYDSMGISRYIPLIESSLNFFDVYYRGTAARRGYSDLDGKGKLVLYPASAGATYKMAYNPSSTIAALRSVLEAYGRKPDMLARIPSIPLRTEEGKERILPAEVWERTGEAGTPQLLPVFPWRIYGVGREGLETARNTYLFDRDVQKCRAQTGEKLDNVWAACLGLTEQASELTLKRLSDGPYRFPAFRQTNDAWTPDLNEGNAGMMGMQEMLLQEVNGKILLFPAWPRGWDVHFKLHAPGQTTVEAEWRGEKLVKLTVTPKEREKDVVNCL